MKKVLILALVCWLFLPASVGAAQFVGGETVASLQGQTIAENYYAAGAMVNFGAAAADDVYLAGANVNVYGDTGKDLTVVGSNVLILGAVGDDLRVAGIMINILRSVEGETLAAGGMVNVGQGAELRGGGYLAAGQLNFDGKSTGDVVVRGGKVIINGTINGNVDIVADEQLVITDEAVIKGNLRYASRQEAEISEQAVIDGEVVLSDYQFKPLEKDKTAARDGAWGLLWGLALFKLVALVVCGLIAYGLFDKHLEKLLRAAGDGFGNKLLLGFGLALILPIAGVVLLFTLLLAPFAALLGLLYCLFMLIAKVAAGMLFGVWLFKFLTKKDQSLTWQNTVAGIIALNVICWIPLFGWIVGAVFTLGLFGALWSIVYNKFLK